jgi:hypothetical protein
LLGVVGHHILDVDRNAKVVLLEVDFGRRSLEVSVGKDLLFLQHHDDLGLKDLVMVSSNDRAAYLYERAHVGTGVKT